VEAHIGLDKFKVKVKALFKGKDCKAYLVHRGPGLKVYAGLGQGIQAVPVEEMPEKVLGLKGFKP
jgi:hypothetical protein